MTCCFTLFTVESGEVSEILYIVMTFSHPQIRTDNMTVIIFQIFEILFMKICRDIIKQEHTVH